MENVTNIFKKRLKELRGKKSQQEVADALKISRVSLGYYESGERKPDIEVLFKLAKYYNVTSDYLLGLSDNSTTDLTIQTICDKTGLSDKAVENIIKLNVAPTYGSAKTTLMSGLEYILSQTISVDILPGWEPDDDYWSSVKEKEYKSSFSGCVQGEVKTVLYYGKGIDFLKKLNHILFNEYRDFNPYFPVGKSGNLINVIETKNAYHPENTFVVLDDMGNSHIFDLSIITKALLLELNDLLTEIRNTITHDETNELIISFDEDSNNWHKLHKEREPHLYSSDTE